MTLTFLPSLEHLAAVKVALSVFHDDIIHFLGKVPLRIFNEDNLSHIFDFNKREGERMWIRENQQKAINDLSKLLPRSAVERVALILHPIVSEIHYWIRDHFYVIKDIPKRLYKNSLCWNLEGTIDRINTAKKFVRNKRIDKRNRFVMACIYFFEKDLKHLFIRMTEDEREKILDVDSNIAVYFWIKWLTYNNKSPWTECVKKYLNRNLLREIEGNRRKSRIRLLSFFSHLSKRNKSMFLHFLSERLCGHINDVYLCYNLLDETARAEIIPSLSILVLRRYLNWPLQSLFLDVVNQMKSHLDCEYYETCLHLLINTKLLRGIQDFDYVNLLGELWNQIPGPYKEELQQTWVFPFLNAALSNENKHPLAIQKVMANMVVEFNPEDWK